jgi:hypothetical protein
VSAPGQYEGLQNELRETRQRAADLDARRQVQIRQQRESIDRLLKRTGMDAAEAEVAAVEIARLCEQLAIQDARLEAVRRYAEGLQIAAEHGMPVGIGSDLLRLINIQ